MATRPVFMPGTSDARPVQDVPCDFQWHAGLALTQKKKNILALHDAARKKGIYPVLEVSSKSDEELGRRLSAFSLKILVGNDIFALEAVCQGSKRFQKGGPHAEWYLLSPKEAKHASKSKDLGELIGFELEGRSFPLVPPTAFYDWLYLRALSPQAGWIAANLNYAGFTDIEFNPEKSVSCQARTLALFKWLHGRGLLNRCVEEFETLIDLVPQV